jgi:GDP-mannose 6-dehydrogenase
MRAAGGFATTPQLKMVPARRSGIGNSSWPLVLLTERLIGRGYPTRIFDRHVQLSRLTRKNRDVIAREIPYLEGLMAPSPEAAMQGAEIFVVGHAGSDEIAATGKRYNGQQIIDLVGVYLLQQLGGRSYHGICW